jgi:DNA topoisomerase VI subunit B
MAPKGSQVSTWSKESQESKSPAEFFAENQAIAGFDDLGEAYERHCLD